MKYRFIHDHHQLMDIKRLCTTVQVSRSAYYRWQQTVPSMRELYNQELLDRISQIHPQSQAMYGSPRIWHSLHQ